MSKFITRLFFVLLTFFVGFATGAICHDKAMKNEEALKNHAAS
jgi:hypothetical protein